MIKLNDIFPFAKGGNRMCFVHPDNPNRCLKVIHPGILTKIKRSKPWYKQLRSSESFDDNLREQKAYNQKATKEMHRHRYEFNNSYLKKFEKSDINATGINPKSNLV